MRSAKLPLNGLAFRTPFGFVSDAPSWSIAMWGHSRFKCFVAGKSEQKLRRHARCTGKTLGRFVLSRLISHMLRSRGLMAYCLPQPGSIFYGRAGNRS
jgi:hypothetical protein